MRKDLAHCKLYGFVDADYLHGRDPVLVARQLCDGGAEVIQLRAKRWTKAEILVTAQKILPVVRSAGVFFVINDHLDIARTVGADLCHLGQEDFFGAGHTRIAEILSPGERVQIGLSTHAPEQAQRAIDAGAHYVAIGPVYATPTKPAVRPVTLDYVRWAAATLTLPWFAIGGINLQNLPQVLEAGAERVCVVSALLNATDLSAECQKYKAVLSLNRRKQKR